LHIENKSAYFYGEQYTRKIRTWPAFGLTPSLSPTTIQHRKKIMAKNLLASPKVINNHSTIIEGAEDVLEFLEKSELVKRFSIGIILNNHARRKTLQVKVLHDVGSVRLKIQSKGVIQEFRVYCTGSQELLEKQLLKTFS
jgi:hypothetical protein